jgi:hypothetical protein
MTSSNRRPSIFWSFSNPKGNVVKTDAPQFQKINWTTASTPNTTMVKVKATKASTAVPTPSLTSDDYALLNELWTTIEQDPTCIEVRKVLVEQLTTFGWIDAAVDAALEVLKLQPGDAAMMAFVEAHRPTPNIVPASKGKQVVKNVPNKGVVRPKTTMIKVEQVPMPKTEEERLKLEKEFVDAVKALQGHAMHLARDMQAVSDMRQLKESPIDREKELERLNDIVNGQFRVTAGANSNSARAVARRIDAETDYAKAMDIAVTDLEAIYLRSKGQSNPPCDDSIRETLAKRCRIITTALRSSFTDHPTLALMHIQHERLGKTYHNTETMYGDTIQSIERADFFTSEDNYAWSMEELTAAITSNSGIMRNPLSKEMFTPTDVSRIITHPIGSKLAAMTLAQDKMSRGVRPSTIAFLEKLSKTFLADMSEDQASARTVLDEFLAHLATLPKDEQDAIDQLRVPAKDSHTGQEFDTSIGDAVRDARANKICVHKTGDLLGQAARWLKGQVGSS